MIAHPDPELIFFSYSEAETGSGELMMRKQLSLYERTPHPAEFFNDVLVHPSGKLAVVCCYAGKLKIVLFNAGNYLRDFDVSCVPLLCTANPPCLNHFPCRLPEINLLGLAFLSTRDDEYTLAVLHLDHQERVQLLARDINVDDLELSPSPSILLNVTPLSPKVFPFPTEAVPQLISVPPAEQQGQSDEPFLGGVLVVGGKKVLLYELASRDGQEKQKGKRRRLETKKKSVDVTEAEEAREKERERERRRRKPKASVDWPWNEVTAYVSFNPTNVLSLLMRWT